MISRLDQIVTDAKTANILPTSATVLAHANRPWPVVLLTALGAWLAAVPLFGVVTVLLGNLLNAAPSLYFIGTLTLVGALTILRSRSVALFIEQLAVPALLVGGLCLGMALYKDLPAQLAAAMVALIALGVAAVVWHGWLRVLMGFVAAGFVTVAIIPGTLFGSASAPVFSWLLASYLALVLWSLAYAALATGASARFSATLESVAAGWALNFIVGGALWAGVNLLQGPSETGETVYRPHTVVLHAASFCLAVVAAAWLARRWPSTRRPWLIGVALILAGLAWMMPSLGGVLFVLALCAASGRWLLCGAAAVATAWIIGAFYYQLSFPLATKAAMLVAAGALLAIMAWLGAPRSARAAQHASGVPAARNLNSIGIVAVLVAVLGVTNTGIWKNERLIATGQPIFVELAPLDPRSLMQGDYMRLNFNIPNGGAQQLPLIGSARPHVVAQRDARAIARLIRLHDHTPLVPGEFLIELSPKDGRWTFVTDAWFFKEGEAQRWQGAKYGEFRVGPDGKALLVDLRGPALEKL